MKKTIYIILIFLIILITIFLLIPKNEKQKNNKIKLAEVTHSVFYSPLYVAIEKGYFEDENIDIELILTPGADKVSTAILSKDIQIGLAGA